MSERGVNRKVESQEENALFEEQDLRSGSNRGRRSKFAILGTGGGWTQSENAMEKESNNT